jgi:hypothetical protein
MDRYSVTMTNYIDLDRHFVPWVAETDDADLMRFVSAYGSSPTWRELLERQRVVLLAEAGSGKSTELTHQAKRLKAQGKPAFIVTLQSIGRKGFRGALGSAEAKRFAAWKESSELGWLFLDSVDEAKEADFTLAEVLEEVADAISGAANRVHVILSGRHSDWEFKRDLKTLLEKIAVPPPDETLAPISPNDALLAAIRDRNTSQENEPTEQPVVVVMAALDRQRVEKFARAKGVTNVGPMFEALERQNLWSFARRPVDLDWLVSYWRSHNAFGSLAEMIEQSLLARLKETNPERQRPATVDVEQAMKALERIGAALVLQRLDTIVIPDTTLDLIENVPSLKLGEVLSDWSSGHCKELISRPVFDPASPGFVRFHNDNEGDVRSFLAAKWLYRLKTKGNCPWARIRDMFFAETHSVKLVIPSMRQTAAWLSLWLPEITQQVLAIDPQLLMEAGDPGSLPISVRTAVLDSVIEDIKRAGYLQTLQHDAVRRFAKPDLAPIISDRWAQHRDSQSVRELLLLLIRLGAIEGCVAIAREAVFGEYNDRYTLNLGGRALSAIGTAEDKTRYVKHLVENAATVEPILAWNALEALFPMHVSIDQFLVIVDGIKDRKSDGSLGLDYYGPLLAQRLSSPDEARRLTAAILDRLAVRFDPEGRAPPQDEPWLKALEMAAIRLFEMAPKSEAPVEAIDAALRVGQSRRFRVGPRPQDDPDLGYLLRSTAERRRASTWRAVAALRAKHGADRPVVEPWQLQFLGFTPALSSADLSWLLDDACGMETEDDVRFAINAALSVWKQDGENPETLARIKAVATSGIAATMVDEWFTPRLPSAEMLRYEREHQAHLKASAVKQAAADASWIDFAERLRANPGQLRDLIPPSDKGADSRIYHLWKLLGGSGDNHSRYAIENLSPLVPMFGEAVVSELRDAFIRYWRHLAPRLLEERQDRESNSISTVDLIGVTGVTQEAHANAEWAKKLTYEEAKLATALATMELNRLPKWLDDIALSHPEAVAEILWRVPSSDLRTDVPGYRYALSRLGRGSDQVVSAIGAKARAYLESHDQLPTEVLKPILEIVRRTFPGDPAMNALCLGRFASAPNRHVRAQYLATAFFYDSERGMAALDFALDALGEEEQALLVQAVLPTVFGGHLFNLVVPPVSLSVAGLQRMIHLAFAKVHPSSDNDHGDGEAYSPDERDDAEDARNALFRRLVDTPGLATFKALMRLKNAGELPISSEVLERYAHQRAGIDSESAPWRTADVRAFEADFESVPATSDDLQRVGISRLDDIEQHLLNGDFNQGLTVARLPKEVDVQNWFANELRTRQGRSYSLEREPHVAEEKEPDIRLQSCIADARSPIEIKVAESWSLAELETALTVQLRERYLRDGNNRFGILLLLHQKSKRRGWHGPNGFMTFEEVVEHLRGIAGRMAAADASAPQMAIVAIDLSKVPRPKAKAPRPKESKA